jgi:glutaredoxin
MSCPVSPRAPVRRASAYKTSAPKSPGFKAPGSAKSRGSVAVASAARGPQRSPGSRAPAFLTAPVLVYTKDGCPYCADAKAKLDAARVPYTEVPVVDAAGNPVPLPDGRTGYTVPQMFLPVGGFSDMDAWLPGALRRAPATPARK